jgi:serine phosphatase RsbU (regulator of sigma subunit)
MVVMKFAGIFQPMPKETVSGDAYWFKEFDNKILWVVMDTLGHGPDAAQLAQKYLAHLEKIYKGSLPEIVRQMHKEFLGTRGLAMGLISIDLAKHEVSFLGVGNISVKAEGKQRMNFISHHGVVAYRLPASLFQTTYTYQPGDLIVMHSDGIRDDFLLSSFSSDLRQEPQLLVETIANNFTKGSDDLVVTALLTQ